MYRQEIKDLIKNLKESNPIKLKIKGNEPNSPAPIHYYNSRIQFTPDIVVFYEKKRDFYTYEPDIKEDDISNLTYKWILFSSEARKKNGRFFLIINKSNSEYCKSVISEKQLEITLIEL